MNHWTARELQLLREHYPSHGSSWDGWAALLPSRTKYAIDMAVKRYGLGYAPKVSAKEEKAPADRYEPLLGCPFCGEAPKVERSADRRWYRISCDNARCGAQVQAVGSSLPIASRNWNRRS